MNWLPPGYPDDPPRLILVCGSREWTDRSMIRLRLATLLPKDPGADEPTIIHGAARGADSIAGEIAQQLGFWVESYPADWKRHGKRAGPIRNREMLDKVPDLVIAFVRGESRGTWDCVHEAEARGIPVEVHRWPHEVASNTQTGEGE